VHAVVDEALGPILKWKSGETDARVRIRDLLSTALPRIDEFEATFKAALKLSIEQWSQRQAGTLGSEPQFTRGHRVDLLRDAIMPLASKLGEPARDRLTQALSLVFGVETLVVLKDIWGLSAVQAQSVVEWAAGALVDAAINETERTSTAKS
jgi:hypothetical protein